MKTPPTLPREIRAFDILTQPVESPAKHSADLYPDEETFDLPESLTMFSLRQIFRELYAEMG
jgi:hypothetical protein